MKQADFIGIRVAEIGLTPEPGAIGWVFFKFEAELFKLRDSRVEVVAFEIKRDAVIRNNIFRDVYG